jgi:hypothetical protein
VSGGEGKTRVLDEKATTLYKRALDVSYHLKIKASRTVFNEIAQRFPTMPFTLRALPGRETRLGLHECLNHSLLHPYPVVHEKARARPPLLRGDCPGPPASASRACRRNLLRPRACPGRARSRARRSLRVQPSRTLRVEAGALQRRALRRAAARRSGRGGARRRASWWRSSRRRCC